VYAASDVEARQAAVLARASALQEAWVARSVARLALTHRHPSPVRPHQPGWADSPPEGTDVPAHPPCPRCRGAEAFERHMISEGVRHGGDTWGVTFELCTHCGWTCWWRWDEA
jgi:hypothetical protein